MKNEIPLVTVTKDGSLFLEGTVVTGCLQTFWKTRRPADYSGGLPQLSCPVKPLLSSLALLEVRKVGMWSSYFMAHCSVVLPISLSVGSWRRPLDEAQRIGGESSQGSL